MRFVVQWQKENDFSERIGFNNEANGIWELVHAFSHT